MALGLWCIHVLECYNFNVLYEGELITSLVTIEYIVGLMIGMYIEYCLWAQVAVLDIYCIYWTVWDR